MEEMMLRSVAVYSGLFACAALLSVPCQAAETSGSSMKLSEAQCSTLWSQANPSQSKTLTQSQAQPYVTDFKSVDSDNDGTISQTEFMTGCSAGHVKGSASSGSGSGSSGSSYK
jgi:hypothetical protein